MFDTVGRDLDVGARRRGLLSGLITTSLLATGVGSLALWGLLTATQRILVVPDDSDLVIVEVADPQLDEAPPAPPAPPAPRGAGTPDAPPVEPKPPETPPDDPAPLDDTVPDEVKSTAPSGPGLGDGPGSGGNGDGDGDGPGGSGTRAGPVALHHSEVVVKRRVMPEFPQAAQAAGISDAVCRVRVFIDREGKPTDLRFEACPSVFQPATEAAVMRWRWIPAEVGGEPVPAQFLLSVQYRTR